MSKHVQRDTLSDEEMDAIKQQAEGARERKALFTVVTSRTLYALVAEVEYLQQSLGERVKEED
jgi:hypothetical protein